MTIKLCYKYSYTTKGGAHRYSPSRKSKVSLGDIYLRGLDKAPRRMTITADFAEV